MKRENFSRIEADSAAVAEYKRLLQEVLESRPSGTRRRLAEALGKNRSFVSQITNPTYSVPIPARHIEAIFDICHFLPNERSQFLDTYGRAHPRRLSSAAETQPRWRELTLRLPDLRNAAKNRQLDELIKETAQRVTRLLEDQLSST